MLTFIERLESDGDRIVPLFTLALTAEERTRTRHRFETPDAQELFLRLPRGTVLQDGDLLRSQSGEIIQIIAKAEPILTVTAQHPLDLLKAAYHLGNRHVPLEIAPTYLRLSRDSVLKGMLEHLGATIVEEIAPFQPEIGAYHHH
jgi:urease accessory protein